MQDTNHPPSNAENSAKKDIFIKESSVHLAKALGKGRAESAFGEGSKQIRRLRVKEGITLTPELQSQVEQVQTTLADRDQYWEWAEKIGQDYEWFEDTFDYVETYNELDKQEQADLMFAAHSLLAEQKDVVMAIHDAEFEEETGNKARSLTISAQLKDGARDITPQELAAFKKIRGTSLGTHHDLARKLGYNVGWLLENFDLTEHYQKATKNVVTKKTKRAKGFGRVRIPTNREISMDSSAIEQRNKARLAEIKEQLAKLGMTPGFEQAYANKSTRAYFIARGAQRREELLAQNMDLEIEVEQLIDNAIASNKGAVTGSDSMAIRELQERIADNERRAAALDMSEDGHAIIEHNTIKEYSEAAANGNLVEFPSAKDIIEDGMEHMRNRRPFMLAGHLGSGKSQLLVEMAKRFMVENGIGYDPNTIDFDDPEALGDLLRNLNPEIFSGSEEASIYNLVGSLRLKRVNGLDPDSLKKEMQKLEEKLAIAKVNVPKEKLAEIIVGNEAVETVFAYGPLGTAIKEGKPIIIDEINMIPAEVLGRLNALLLERPGNKIKIQENGEEVIELEPGTVFLASLNLGKQYAGIKQVNAAFKNRWISREVDYPAAAETFDLMTAMLIRKDRVMFPADFPQNGLEKMTDLTMAVREIQENFSGKTVGKSFMSKARGRVEAESTNLKDTVISTRDLVVKILQPWKKKNFEVEKNGIHIAEKTVTKKDGDGNETSVKVEARDVDKDSLDVIIAKFILAAEVFNIDDQRFMVEIFLRRGFFDGWTEETFKEHGITSIGDMEIKTLQAEMGTDEYQQAMKDIGDFAQEIEGSNTSLIGAKNLLVGAYNTR